MVWLRLCGAYNLCFAVLHVVFLAWFRELPMWEKLPGKVGPLLDVFNIQVAVALFLASGMYFFHAPALRTTVLGRMLLAGWLVFWTARLVDDLLFGFQPLWLAFFALGVLLHAAALRAWRHKAAATTA